MVHKGKELKLEKMELKNPTTYKTIKIHIIHKNYFSINPYNLYIQQRARKCDSRHSTAKFLK